MQSEASFRNALAGILEKNFDIKVLNINEYDEQDGVLGRPDQVELNVIIKNALLLICELKSSIDNGWYVSLRAQSAFLRTALRLQGRLPDCYFADGRQEGQEACQEA